MKKIAWKSISPMRLNDLKGGRLRLIPFLLVISAVLFVMSVACSKDDGGTSEPATVPVSSIKLTQTSVTLNVGESVELTATVSPSNATNRTVKWSSSNTNIATVTDGKVTAKAVGTATIKAQCGNVKAECSITVKAAGAISINLNPTSAELYEDETIQLTATVTPEDTSEPITWKSSNEEIAIVSEGKVYARKVGKADITASVGSGDNAKTATCSVTVKCHVEGVKLENHSLTVKQGQRLQLSATVYPERASNKEVSWSSDAPSIVSVSETGMLEAKSSGTAKITVETVEGGFKDECVVTVISDVDGIALNKTELDLRVKEIYQLTATVSPQDATNKDVTWTSDNQTVATVDDNGKVTAVAPGKAVICATTKDGGLKAFCSVKVRSRVDEITLSEKEMTLYTTDASKRTLTATVTPADADFTLIWKSDNEAVATVKASGKTTCEVTPVGRGNTTIRVSTADGFVSKNTVSVTVKQPYTEIKLNKSQLTLNKGVAEQLTATPSPQTPDDFIVWSSDRTDIATVDNNGNVTAVKAGTAKITAASKLRPNVVKATCTVKVTSPVIPVTGVSVSPTRLSLKTGESRTITATIVPANATNKEITWSSSNESVATVSNGKVTAVAPGEAVICATTQDGGHLATCTVTVTSPVVHVTGVSVKPTELTMYKGESKTITATITPSNAENKNVSWRSSNSSVATVNAYGKIVALSVGSTMITVTTEDGWHEASCNVTVKDNPVNVTSITLDKSSFFLSFGDSETINATIRPENATNKGIIWTSSDPAVAKVEGGTVTAMSKEGTVTITAKSADNSGKYATCTVRVVRRFVPVTGLEVSPTSLRICLGQKAQQIIARVLPNDATDKTVIWSVQQGGVAAVDQGWVTPLRKGTTRVFVKTKDERFSETVLVTVWKNDVKSIELPYNRITLKVGETYDLTATVNSVDASLPASNPNVTWKSSSATIATVASLEGTYVNKKTGRITAHKAGTTTITVTSQDNPSVRATCEVNVVSSVVSVTGVSVSPTTLTLNKGESSYITATVQPANATNKEVIWTSSNTAIATVDNNGKVTAMSKEGTVTITAKSADNPSKAATCTVKVTSPVVHVTGVSVSPTTLSLNTGENRTITATIQPANATNKKVNWTSSDPTVAKVEGGKVTAMSKEGTVTITAKSADNPSKYATCTVTVTRPVVPVTSIALNKTSATLSAGETVQLTATVSPNNATNKTVTWSSSNTSVATVSNGKVTAKAAGSATITARTNNGLSATCSITVVKDGDVPPGGSEETGEEEWK